MFVDSATTANEKQVAHNKMKTLCKKHNVVLQAFIDNCTFDKAFETRQIESSEAQATKRGNSFINAPHRLSLITTGTYQISGIQTAIQRILGVILMFQILITCHSVLRERRAVRPLPCN